MKNSWKKLQDLLSSKPKFAYGGVVPGEGSYGGQADSSTSGLNVLGPQGQQQQNQQTPAGEQQIASGVDTSGQNQPAQNSNTTRSGAASSGQFTNLQKYTQANQSALGNLGSKIKQGLATDAQAVGQAVQDKLDTYKTDLTNQTGKVQAGTQALNQATQTNTLGPLSDEAATAYQQASGVKYDVDPNKVTAELATQVDPNVTDSAAKRIQEASNLGTDTTAVSGLINQYNKTPYYQPGYNSLSSYLFQKSGALPQIAEAGKAAQTAITTGTDEQQAQAAATLGVDPETFKKLTSQTEAQSAYDQSVQALKDAQTGLGTAKTGFTSAIQNIVASKAASAKEQYDTFQNAIKTGQVSDADWAKLSADQQKQLTDLATSGQLQRNLLENQNAKNLLAGATDTQGNIILNPEQADIAALTKLQQQLGGQALGTSYDDAISGLRQGLNYNQLYNALQGAGKGASEYAQALAANDVSTAENRFSNWSKLPQDIIRPTVDAAVKTGQFDPTNFAEAYMRGHNADTIEGVNGDSLSNAIQPANLNKIIDYVNVEGSRKAGSGSVWDKMPPQDIARWAADNGILNAELLKDPVYTTGPNSDIRTDAGYTDGEGGKAFYKGNEYTDSKLTNMGNAIKDAFSFMSYLQNARNNYITNQQTYGGQQLKVGSQTYGPTVDTTNYFQNLAKMVS